MSRRSYSSLMRQPAWLLLDENKKIVGSCRATTKKEALAVFRKGKLKGRYLRRVKDEQ